MTTYEHAPSPAHVIRHEAQALIDAINDGDEHDAASTLATIAELVSTMQRRLDRDLVANTCPGTWVYNGRPVYPEHHRTRPDDAGQTSIYDFLGAEGGARCSA